MKIIHIDNLDYEVVDEFKNALDEEELKNIFTDYFYAFDYVLGDYSYNKLRLKGFYKADNKKVQEYNNVDKYKNYLEDFCASECPYFLLKKQIKS